MTDLYRIGLHDAAKRIRSGKLKPSTYLKSLLARIDSLEDAFVERADVALHDLEAVARFRKRVPPEEETIEGDDPIIGFQQHSCERRANVAAGTCNEDLLNDWSPWNSKLLSVSFRSG